MCVHPVACVIVFTVETMMSRRHADSGGAFKVQICSPYIIVNKTGLPFAIKATRSTRAGSQDVAGDSRKGS